MHVFSLVSRALLAVGIASLSLPTLSSTEVSLEQYHSKIKQHPEVAYWLEQKLGTASQAQAALGLPDPQIIIGLDNVPIDTFAFNDYLPTSKVIGFRQHLPSSISRNSQEEKFKQMGRFYQLQADYRYQQLLAELKTELIKLDENRKLASINRKKLSYYWSIEEDLKGQLEAGVAVYGRLSEVDIDRTDIHQLLNSLKAKRVEIESSLIRLIDEVPDHAEYQPAELQISWNPNTTSLYPIQIAEEQVRVVDHDRRIADAAFKPNYGIQALYKQRNSGDQFDGDDWFSIQATISVPLWSRTHQTPKREAAESHYKSAQWQLDDTRRLWIQRMATLDAQRDMSKRNIELFQAKTASLQQIVQAARRNYESGSSRLEPVLRAQIDQLTLKEKLLQEKSHYWVLSVQFESYVTRTQEVLEGTNGGTHEAQ